MTGTANGPIELVAQYVRDLSFEHPNAPHSIDNAHTAVPAVDIEVSYRQIDATNFESSLSITGSIKSGDEVVAVVELSYAATYRIPAMAAELRETFLMVDAARELFPFARALVGMVTQAAGIPPLYISAPNFQEAYRRICEARLQTAKTS
jgi:preprotein translocase subunit SecB